jgi:hypothetical protein
MTLIIMDKLPELSQEYQRIMFSHYMQESVLSLISRFCDVERRIPRLSLEGKFEQILFDRQDLEIVIKAIMYHEDEEIKQTRRKLQLEVQYAKASEKEVNSYREKEIQIQLLADLLYNGIIPNSTRTLLHRQP